MVTLNNACSMHVLPGAQHQALDGRGKTYEQPARPAPPRCMKRMATARPCPDHFQVHAQWDQDASTYKTMTPNACPWIARQVRGKGGAQRWQKREGRGHLAGGTAEPLGGKDTIRDQAVFVAETWYTYYL
jgi:hypothetical protein